MEHGNSFHKALKRDISGVHDVQTLFSLGNRKMPQSQCMPDSCVFVFLFLICFIFYNTKLGFVTYPGKETATSAEAC